MDSDGLLALRYDGSVVYGKGNVVNPVYVLFFGLFSIYIGQSILAPVLPPLIRELGLSELQGGLIMTFSSIMWVIFSPIWGRRSEVWGRKPVFMIAMLGYAIGVGAFGIIMQLSLNGVFATATLAWILLVLSRMVVGMTFSAGPPASQAYVADTTTGQQRTNAMGFISAASGLGTIFGPALGGLVVGLGLAAPIYLSALLPLIGLLAVGFLLPHIQPRIVKGQKPPRVSALDPRIWPILCVGISVTTILALVNFTIGYYFQDRLQLDSQGTAQAVSLALVGSGIAALIAQVVLIRLFRWPPLTLLRIGLPLLLSAMILLVVSTNFTLLTLALIVQGLGMGLAFPGFRAAMTFAVEPHEQGAAAGVTSSIGGIGFIVGPSLGTGLYGMNMLFPFLLAAAILILGLMILFMHPVTRVRRSPQAA